MALLRISLIALIFVALPSTSAFADTLIFGRDKTMRDEFPDVSTVLMEVYGQLGFTLDFQEASARRALLESDRGAWDGEVLRIASIIEQAPNLRMVPVPLATIQIVLFQHSEHPELRLEQLRGKRIAVPAGYRIAQQLSERLGFELMETTDIASALKMVELGRADATLHGLQAGLERIGTLNLAHVITHGHTIAQIPLYHFVHRKHDDLIPKLTPLLEARLKHSP